MRHLPICSVDPPGCKDIDDALHVRQLPSGNLELGVHIADVTNFLLPMTAMDDEASIRRVLRCAVLCCAVLCCATLCCAVPRCAVLCCPMLCSAVLCCALLCCAMLCCATLQMSYPAMLCIFQSISYAPCVPTSLRVTALPVVLIDLLQHKHCKTLFTQS